MLTLQSLLALVVLPASAQDTTAPTLLVLAPARDSVIGGGERVKVQFWDETGAAVSNPLRWEVDGGGPSAAGVTPNPNYSCGTNCVVYEFPLDTSLYSNGPHTLTLTATDSLANSATLNWPFQVNNLVSGGPAGDGRLLRRTRGSQICLDCHNLASHSSQWTGTKYGNWAIDCLTCHTPHDTTNIFLIREQLQTPNSGPQSILFHIDDRAGDTNPGSGPGSYSFLGAKDPTNSTGPYNDGICEACHTQTDWHRNDGSSDTSHNQGTRCLKCHDHAVGFQGSGACLDCHGNAGDTGTAGPNSRRPVLADFGQTSHHVGDGGVMGGTLTSFDCVVCHAEGRVDTGGAQPEVATNPAYHGGDGGTTSIDLKDVDTWDDANPTGGTVVVYSFDKEAISGGAANWNSTNSAWRYQTSGFNEVTLTLDAGRGLDRFCLSCHDSDGATTSNNTTDAECTSIPALNRPFNPFCDGAISNANDEQNRTAVVDIRSKVSNTGADGNADGIPDTAPVNGQWARHAIRGQSTSRYSIYELLGNVCGDTLDQPCSSIWEKTKVGFCQGRPSRSCANDGDCGNNGPCVLEGVLVQTGISDPLGPLWNDTSVMGCADCHTVDGAHGSGGNAHGSPSEYLLKDVDDSDGVSEGTLASLSYVCYRCHDAGWYFEDGNHTGNSQDWVDTTGGVGLVGRVNPAGTPTDGSIFGIACFNCHGGTNWGNIHGTSEVLPIERNGAGGTRRAYRFTNGSSQRFFDPDNSTSSDTPGSTNWAADQFSCYTLGTEDNFGSCTQHNGQSFTRPVPRPADY